MLLYAFLLSVATGTLFGLVPALQASRVALVPALKEETPGHRRAPLRSVLVAAQVAFCLVLLACAGLFARSLGNALATDPGFSTAGRGARLRSPRPRAVRRPAGVELCARSRSAGRRAARRARGLLGRPPAAFRRARRRVGHGARRRAGTAAGRRRHRRRAPEYFRALGIGIVAGREFDAAADSPDGPPAIVVNEAAARRFWPGENPLGRRLQIYGAERTVVGVSRDTLFRSLQEPGVPLVVTPIQQLGGDGVPWLR